MTKSLSVAQLKAHLSEVLGEVQHTRTEVVIERHGKPVARLVPLANEKPRGFLALAEAFDGAGTYADALDAVVAGRRKDKRRKVAKLK